MIDLFLNTSITSQSSDLCVEFVCLQSSLAVVNYLQNVTRMFILAGREGYLFVLGNMIGEVVINGREVTVEDFKVIPSQYVGEVLNILKISVSVL